MENPDPNRWAYVITSGFAKAVHLIDLMSPVLDTAHTRALCRARPYVEWKRLMSRPGRPWCKECYKRWQELNGGNNGSST